MLKQNKDPRVENFDFGFLNKVAEVISYPLTKIFRKLLEYCVVPIGWKKVKCLCNFQKG